MHDDVDALFGSIAALKDSTGTTPLVEYEQPPFGGYSEGWLYRFWRDKWRMDVEQQPHVEMAGFVQESLGDCSFSGDTQTLVMLGVPRGTFKTTGVSEATPVAVLEKNPNAKILLDGFRHGVAKARLRAVRRKIENDEVLAHQDWKPEFRSDTWNDEEIIITPRTDNMSREASIATAGVDRSMNSQHFDVIIADDLVTDTNVQTAEGRERVHEHISDLLPILNPGGVLIIVFTTWHVDDAYMRRIRADEDRVRRGLPPKFKKLIRGCYDGPTGLYFPRRQSHEFLEETLETIGSRKFAAQYLLKPMADEDKTFLMDAMRLRRFDFYTDNARPLGGFIRLADTKAQLDVETSIAWDPAGRRQTRKSDSHGITVVGTDFSDVWWVLEALALKAPPTVVIDRMCRLILIYRPWVVSVEDAFGSGLWLDMLKDECVRRGLRVNFVEYSTGNVPKNERIVLLQPRWENGKTILRAGPDGLPVHPRFVTQFDRFSPGTTLDHEDELDSLVQHLRLTRVPEEQQVTYDYNPMDADYAAFQKRRDAESEGARSMAGRYGAVWKAG